MPTLRIAFGPLEYNGAVPCIYIRNTYDLISKIGFTVTSPLPRLVSHYNILAEVAFRALMCRAWWYKESLHSALRIRIPGIAPHRQSPPLRIRNSFVIAQKPLSHTCHVPRFSCTLFAVSIAERLSMEANTKWLEALDPNPRSQTAARHTGLPSRSYATGAIWRLI